MPVILGLLALAAGVVFWMMRAQGAANTARDVADMAQDVRLAARRFGFRRRADIHPAESIEDPKLAVAGIAVAFAELDDLPTAEDRARLHVALRAVLRMSDADAQEMEVLGRWLMTQCGGPDATIARLSRKLFRLDGGGHADALDDILTRITDAAGKAPSRRQAEALEDIARALRPR
ncbi:MAG: hypothetical protein HLUCCA08_06845 [Rhodobacteraceae bacterium HLUCCA08]|nr:MAG: hypothetical protein HLUCCA08_06845 [Rhodobacteraceae bacterium HLUCCA08]